MLRDEFLIQLQKFLNQIGLTLRQLEGNPSDRTTHGLIRPRSSSTGEVRLELPPNFDISKVIKSNRDVVDQAESLVYKWNGEIREALERELKKVNASPIEIETMGTRTPPYILDGAVAWPVG